MPNESTSLLVIQSQPNILRRFFSSPKSWRGIGFGTTCGAMIPQGLLGMVLWDEQIMQKYCHDRDYLPLRISTDAFIIIGSIVGKLMIVFYYNGPSWENFAHLSWQKLNPDTWTKSGTTNAIFTMPISSFFGWLAYAGCSQAADVFRDYHTDITDEMANIVASPFFYIPFCAIAFSANLLSFPPIHRGAVNVLRSYVETLLRSTDYKAHERQFRYEVLETVRMRLKYLYEHQNDEYKNTVEKILNVEPSSTITKDNFNLQALFQFANNTVKPESWLEWFLKGSLVPINSGIVTAGVYNFYSLTVGALTNLFCLGKDDCELDTGGKILANAIAIMVLTSMGCMALSIMDNNTNRALRHLFGRPPLNVLNWPKTITNYIWSVLVVMFGATPNTQQAFMAHLSIPLKILAPISSMGYEGLGTVDVTEAMFIKKTEPQKTAENVDVILRQWEENISKDDVHEFEQYKGIERVEKYNGWYNWATSFYSRREPQQTLNIQGDDDLEIGKNSSSARSSWCTIL
jgi:predicted permease